MSTVIVAATVVEMFAPIERNASLKKSFARGISVPSSDASELLGRQHQAMEGRREPR